MAGTPAQKSDEATESLDQWLRFCFAGPNPEKGGEISREPGLTIACARTMLPLGNIAVLTDPVQSPADLADKIETADNFFAARNISGVFFAGDNLLESLRSEVAEVFARSGYAPDTTVMGMAADFLAAPVRPLPAMRYCRATDPDSRLVVAELNILAYGFPFEWARDYDERANIWNCGAFGIVGYIDDRPAACAVTLPLDGRLYVALVATAPEFRQRGCAEAVIRRSLEDAAAASGFSRTVLHATPTGHPLYAQMGYHDTVPFTVYARAEEHA